MIGEMFQLYSQYTGRGILMVLFFVSLFYIAQSEKKHTVKTVLMYGNVALLIFIFLPPVYLTYVTYVDHSTYWRMWWMIPVGIGLAYVGTRLIAEHRWTGFFMIFLVLLLGGEFVYTSNPTFEKTENIYQIPSEVVTMIDYMEEYDEGIVYAAFPPELLGFARQYDVDMRMPYGREQWESNWSEPNGFYLLMSANTVNFKALAEKCLYNYTRYIVVNRLKSYENQPKDNGFRLLLTAGVYELYEYTEVDWEQRREELENL